MPKIRLGNYAKFIPTLLVVFSLGIASQLHAAPLPRQLQQLKDAHQRVMARMNAPGADGKLTQLDDARMLPLLKEGWQLVGEWAAAWLEEHPGATSKAMAKLFEQFSPSLDDSGIYDPKKPEIYALGGFATPIGKGVYVVTAAYYETQGACGAGTFLVVGRDATGHLHPLWSVKPVAERRFEKRDEVGHWAYLGCGAYYNGPLIAHQVITLPAARNGELRFAVDAYEATNGSTLLHHLSLWQWDGKEAANLLAGAYQDYIDDKRGPVLQDGVLTLPTTEITSSFMAFGAAQEPRGEWRIHLTPDMVKDLGHRFLHPQVAWLDALFSAVAAGHDASGLASPAAIDQVRAEWKEENPGASGAAEKLPSDSSTGKDAKEEPSFNLGFLYQYRSTGPGSFAVNCDEARIRVTYRMRAGKPYITSVRFLDPN
jgi:hypothetical protein